MSGPVYIADIEQGSPEWLSLRGGIPTASGFSNIVTSKGEPSKSAQKYMYQLAGERLTGAPMESYTNGNMARGNEMEAEARAAYEFITDNHIEQVAFCFKDERRLYGASPDGLVGADGGVEFKNPILTTAVEYLDKKKLPTIYTQQTQGFLLVTGREWIDFMAYFPGLKPLIIRVERDEKFIRALECELDDFCGELNALVERLRG